MGWLFCSITLNDFFVPHHKELSSEKLMFLFLPLLLCLPGFGINVKFRPISNHSAQSLNWRFGLLAKKSLLIIRLKIRWTKIQITRFGKLLLELPLYFPYSHYFRSYDVLFSIKMQIVVDWQYCLWGILDIDNIIKIVRPLALVSKTPLDSKTQSNNWIINNQETNISNILKLC